MGWKWLVIAAFERNVLIQFAQVFSHMDVTAILCVRVCVHVCFVRFSSLNVPICYICSLCCGTVSSRPLYSVFANKHMQSIYCMVQMTETKIYILYIHEKEFNVHAR